MNYIYTRSYPPCSYCTRVKALLDAYGIPYTEKTVAELEEESHRPFPWPTVPQVFLNNKHIGGYEATAAFLRKGSEGSDTYKVN